MKRYKSIFQYKDDEILNFCIKEDQNGGRFCGNDYIFIEKVIDNSVELTEIGDLIYDHKITIQKCSYIDECISLLNNFLVKRKIKFLYTGKDNKDIIPIGGTSIKNQDILIYCSSRFQELLESTGNNNIFEEFLTNVFRILGHELIHREQILRIKRQDLIDSIHKKSSEDKRKYYSNKYEIMAYAWQIVNSMRMSNLSDSSIKKILSLNSKTKFDLGGDILQIYHNLFKDSSSIIKRLYKQMYEYLEV